MVERYTRCQRWRSFPKESWYKDLREFMGNGRFSACEIGCGDGINICEAALVFPEATFSGFDLSQDSIALAQRRIEVNHLQERVTALCANAESSDPEPQIFDAVLAIGVIHHVQIEAVMPNILQRLRPGGLVIFSEPTAFSKSLQWLRDRSGVPKEVSEFERQLDMDEVKALAAPFERVEVRLYLVLARLSRFLRSKDGQLPSSWRGWMINLLFGLDYWALRLAPGLGRLAGHVVITGYKPQ